jgi:transcriptional regulator with XRE-family HTH domain
MHTIEQIRAARALIGWSQGELADQAGLSQTGIARIENGTNRPNSNTLIKIRAAFDRVDVEFLGSNGVRKRTDEIRTLRGVEGLRQMIDDLYDTTKAAFDAGENIEGFVDLYNAKPANWHKWLGKDWWDMHSKRMTTMNDKIQRLVISETDTFVISGAFSEHKAFPNDLFSDQSIYAYGDKLAFVTFGEDVTVRILSNKEFCRGFRILFNIAWENVAKTLD